MDSKKFLIQLRYRFKLPIPSINIGSSCSCKGYPRLDLFGYHLSSLCGKDGYRTGIHDTITHTINQCCHANGIHTKLEPRNLFRCLDPEDGDRPDIVLMNAPGFEKVRIAADVRVSHPISTPSHQISRNQAANFGSKGGSTAAKKSFAEKIKKFQVKCNQLDIGFYPFLFSSLLVALYKKLLTLSTELSPIVLESKVWIKI